MIIFYSLLQGVYDKAKKQPELLLSQVVGYKSHPERLGSAKLDVHEHANKKVPGQTYEQADKISISNKVCWFFEGH